MTVAAVFCRPFALFPVTPYAEFVAGFMVKFEVLRRTVVTRRAFVNQTVHTMIEIHISIVS